MFELIESRPDCNVQEAEYKRLLGFPASYVLEGRPRLLADEARQWYAQHGRPVALCSTNRCCLKLDGQRLHFNGTAFSSQQLHDNFDDAKPTAHYWPWSAPAECEERARAFWQEGKPDEYFFMEMYGSAVVEHLITVASGRISTGRTGRGWSRCPHYSPGYSGWDVADQTKLWALIRHGNGSSFPGELTVMDTGMLKPKKSLLALFGLTRHVERVRHLAKLIPCENCSLSPCRSRRSPYRNSPPQIEDVRRLQSAARPRQAHPAFPRTQPIQSIKRRCANGRANGCS